MRSRLAYDWGSIMTGTFRDLFLLETLGSWERDRSRDFLVLVGGFCTNQKTFRGCRWDFLGAFSVVLKGARVWDLGFRVGGLRIAKGTLAWALWF